MMMNLDHVPPIPAHALVSEALSLLADPKAAAKLYDKLVGAHAQASAAFDEAKKLRDEVCAQRQAHASDVAIFEQNQAGHAEFLRQAGGRLDEREAALVRKEQELKAHIAGRESALAEAIAQHDARAAAFLDTVKRLTAEARSLLPT